MSSNDKQLRVANAVKRWSGRLLAACCIAMGLMILSFPFDHIHGAVKPWLTIPWRIFIFVMALIVGLVALIVYLISRQEARYYSK